MIAIYKCIREVNSTKENRFKVEDNADARGNSCKRVMNKYRLKSGRRLLLEQWSSLLNRGARSIFLVLRLSLRY